MNIIEKMYDGDLFPIGTYDHRGKEYMKAMDDLISAETELLNTYPQIKELFNKYQDAQIALISINNRQEFVNWFRIGAQMAMEMIKPIK